MIDIPASAFVQQIKPVTQPVKYSAVGQIIHWLTAILVLVAFIYGPGGSESRVYSASHDAGRQIHETLGLCVFALVIARALWRIGARRPPSPAVPRWMRLAAVTMQVGLYALMFGVPITAISGAWLEGHSLTLLGGVTVSPMMGKAHDMGAAIAQIHGWLGDAILWLAGLHASAALFHHLVLNDDVLASMLPERMAARLTRL